MGRLPVDLKEADGVEREIDTLRRRTADLVSELERRITSTVDRVESGVARVQSGIARARQLTDVPALVRAHPRAAAGVGAGTLAALGAGVWLLIARRQRPVRRLRGRAPSPSLGRRIVTGLMMSLAMSLVSRIMRA